MVSTSQSLKARLEQLGLLGLAEATARAARSTVTARGRAERAQRALMRGFYRQFIEPGALVFDVGANVGLRTEIFLDLGATVVAVEPQEHCVRRLRRHFGTHPRAVVIPFGLDSARGEQVLRGLPGSPLTSMSDEWIQAAQSSGRFGSGEYVEQGRVRTTTLDALIEVFGRPAFCKIDVEGFEARVVRGLSVPIASLSLEYHPESTPTTREAVLHLDTLGRYEFNFSLAETMELAFRQWLPSGDLFGALAELVSERGSLLYGDVYARVVSPSP